MNAPADRHEVMKLVEGKLAALRESRFPCSRISSCDGDDGRPSQHAVTAAELLAFIQESISLAHQYEYQWRFTAEELILISSKPRFAMHIDCSNLHITQYFLIKEEILKDFGEYYIEFDFSLSTLDNITISFDAYKKRIGLVLRKTKITGFAHLQLNESSGIIHVTDSRFSDAFILTGNFDSIEIKKSIMTQLYIRASTIRSLSIIDSSISAGVKITGVTIQEDISFRESRIKSSLKFLNCKFKLPPDFHDVSAPSETTFLHIDYGLATDKKRSEVFIESKRIMNDTPGRFRALRIAMKKAGAQHEEAEFFAQELRSRRRAALYPDADIKMDIAEIAVSCIYDWVSVFGTSILRALLSFAIWNFAFWIVFYIFEIFICEKDQCFLKNKIENVVFSEHPAFAIALQNALNPLSIFASNTLVSANSTMLLALSLLQGIGSVSIAALLLLAIKGRFQRSGGGNT